MYQEDCDMMRILIKKYATAIKNMELRMARVPSCGAARTHLASAALQIDLALEAFGKTDVRDDPAYLAEKAV